MRRPVRYQEGMKLVEVPVVEHQKELATIRTQALNRMGHTRREQPQVALAYIAQKTPAFLIHGGNARAAVEHDGPFGFHVPMEFTDTAGCEAHFHACDGRRNRQIAHRDLACPPPALETLA